MASRVSDPDYSLWLPLEGPSHNISPYLWEMGQRTGREDFLEELSDV